MAPANAFVTEQTASAFPARVMASHVRDAAGKGRPRLINLEHLAALDATETSNALYNSGSFGGALAAGTGHLLHDGRIHPHFFSHSSNSFSGRFFTRP